MAEVTLSTPGARPASALTARAVFWRGGLTALLYLAGGLPLVFGVAFLLSRLPYHMDLFESPLLGMALFVGVTAGGGGLWGRSLARLTGRPEVKTLAWAAAGSFLALVFSAAFALGQLEVVLVEERGAGDMPIYLVFAALFTLSSGYVTGGVGAALGLALRDRALALDLAWRGGLAGAAAFLAADVLQHLLGRVVGGPNAAATATMLTVMAVGHAAAALAGGGVIAARIWTRAAAVPQ
ncbi:MAG: hypothetical protein JNK29_04955 [Anaerolineales bacterium]|nr:hypothetical protein [Anaerolineales bacterium]